MSCLSGREFYVDFTSGSDLNSGISTAAPWKNLAKVESSIAAGDTVYFKRGEVWTVKGLLSATAMLQIAVPNVILDAYGVGALPVISGGGVIRNGIVLAPGATGTTTKNLRSYNCGGGTGALWNNSSGGLGTIEDCELDTHIYDAGGSSNVGSDSVVRRCDISHCADDGFTCHGLNGVGASVAMYNCTIHDGFAGINHSVTNGGDITTLCEDCVFYSNSSRDLDSMDVGHHTFNRCRFGVPGKVSSGKIVQVALEDSVTFNYCIFDAQESLNNSGLRISIASAGNCAVDFNNCVFKGNASIPGYTGTMNVYNGDIVNLRNCIFSNWFRVAYRDTAGALVVAQNCIFHEVTVKDLSTNTAQVSIGDPLFVDPGIGDFHLQSGSPAINAGVLIPEIMTDFYGMPIVPDVGVAEHV